MPGLDWGSPAHRRRADLARTARGRPDHQAPLRRPLPWLQVRRGGRASHALDEGLALDDPGRTSGCSRSIFLAADGPGRTCRANRALRLAAVHPVPGRDEQPEEPLPPVDTSGRSRASHSAAAYRRANPYVILHGATSTPACARSGRSRSGGSARDAAPDGDLNPIAGMDSAAAVTRSASTPATASSTWSGTTSTRAAGLASHAANEALSPTGRIRGKPYAIAEWGTSVDDPGFIRRSAASSRAAAHAVAAYYNAGTSPWLLGDSRRARAAYRAFAPLGAR